MGHSEAPFDRIRLSRWSLQVAIGAYDHEKSGTQALILDLTLWGDFRRACESDDLSDALDYAEFKSQMEAWTAEKRWQLLEAFGEQFCQEALRSPLISQVELTVEKPAALAPALVSYTLKRSR